MAQAVHEAAVTWADRAAFILPGGAGEGLTSVSYRELGSLMNRFAAGLSNLALPPGSRLMLLTPPTPEIYALALAVLRSGHVLVTVDGRASAGRILHAVRTAAADVVVAAPRAMRWWPLIGALRRARRFTAGAPVFGARGLEELYGGENARPPPPATVQPEDTAVISFSSGNTGPAKRIERSHRLLSAQHAALKQAFPAPDPEINLPGFPLLVLHNLSLGVTTVLPSVDLRSMAAADPTTVIQAIRACGVTSMSAAPAFIGGLANAPALSGETLGQVRRLVIGGGPVSRRLARAVLAAFPNAEAFIVYGATEAEPMATAPLTELLEAGESETGFLAGWPVAGLEFRIDAAGSAESGPRRISSEADCAGAGQLRTSPEGELLVRGPHVLPSGHPEGWHRTGDHCRLDARGRLWLLGRVGAEIRRGGRTLHPFPLEARAGDLPGVAAAALVAHPAAPEGELVVELAPGAEPATVTAELRRLTAALGLGELPVRRIDHVPMDARHHSKVDRLALVKRLAGTRR